MKPDDLPDFEPDGDLTPDPDIIPSGRVWAYTAAILGLFCWPVGIVAGVIAFSKGELDRRSYWMAVTGITLGTIGILYTLALLAKEARFG